MLTYHAIAFFIGFVMDLLFGDPHWLPHPIRLIGWLISKLENSANIQTGKGKEQERKLIRKGLMLTITVLLLTAIVSGSILLGAYALHPLAGVFLESIMTYQILATKCLKDESMKVYDCLQTGTLEEARKAVSMIVGRDTETLDETGIIKAAVETVAENTSDGVIAPMLYLAAGGPVLGFLYKAVNTMDSMIGYKNERYLYFGRVAAKLDDVVNFLPSRISAWLMIGAAFLLGKEFDEKNAVKIYRRDRRKHASPNSAQTEAVCAGALGIRLAGDASYFGKLVKKPYIGEELRKIEAKDIQRVNQMLYLTAGLCEAICVLILWTMAHIS